MLIQYIIIVIFLVSITHFLSIFHNKNLSIYGNYCGPSNGQNYTLKVKDNIDNLCKEHDYCIENNIGLGKYIPLRSHTNNKYGCIIKYCDEIFIINGNNTKCYGIHQCLFRYLSIKYHESKVYQTCVAINMFKDEWKCTCKHNGKIYNK